MNRIQKICRPIICLTGATIIATFLSACSSSNNSAESSTVTAPSETKAPAQTAIRSSDSLPDYPQIMAVKPRSADVPQLYPEMPIPKSIEPNIQFWINVFGVWDLPEVVFHDDQHLGVIYDKVLLNKDGDGERYGDINHEFLEMHLEDLKQQLDFLEIAVTSGTSLNPSQQALYDKIIAGAGPQAIYNASERVRYQRGQKRRYLAGLANEAKYLPLFRAIFHETGVPENIAYLPHVESSFRTGLRSKAGATGMWQFTKGARRVFMLNHRNIDERNDPVAAARGAARYIKGAYSRVGAWPLAVTSYNHGINGMSNARTQFGTDIGAIHDNYKGKYFKFASRNFYPELIAVEYLSRNRKQYFGDVVVHPPLDLAAIVLDRPMHLPTLVANLGYTPMELMSLNPGVDDSAWYIPTAELPAGMIVWLPADAVGRVPGAISAKEPAKLAKRIVHALPPSY